MYKAGRNRGFHNKTKVHFLADVNIRKIRNIRCTLTVLCQTCPLDSRKLCLLWPWPRGRTRIYGFQIHLVKRVLLASVSNEAHWAGRRASLCRYHSPRGIFGDRRQTLESRPRKKWIAMQLPTLVRYFPGFLFTNIYVTLS